MRDAEDSILHTICGELVCTLLIRHGLLRATFPEEEGLDVVQSYAAKRSFF